MKRYKQEDFYAVGAVMALLVFIGLMAIFIIY
jgi:hypothetical protein